MTGPENQAAPAWNALEIVSAIHIAAAGGDLVDVLDRVADAAARLAGVRAGAIYLGTGDRLHLVGGSADRQAVLDLMNELANAGPCVECRDSGVVVVRWLSVGTGGAQEPVVGIPLSFRGEMLGAVGLICEVEPADDSVIKAQALADVAAVLVACGDPSPDSMSRIRAVRMAVDGRVLLEQASGMLAERLGLTPAQAHQLMRTAANEIDMGLAEIARAVVDRRVSNELASHFRRLSARWSGDQAQP
ncbi:MAG: GAF and ANTAR domain-containing protein [Actinomycetota bacterium]|nr:GAF and ANTAR domain-containing protein [Actinomycetota bacterium]MDA3029087.1 GAF and ANTAR domain-containing protein [Actinomycetota bacterium]